MQSTYDDTSNRPRITVKGGPDRDARMIPYEIGNRAARRAMNAKVNGASKAVRKRVAANRKAGA